MRAVPRTPQTLNLSGSTTSPSVSPVAIPPVEPVIPMLRVPQPPQVKVIGQEPVVLEPELIDIFVRQRKVVVGTTMRQSVYDIIQSYPKGVSAFFEDAITTFQGSSRDLFTAADRFEEARRQGTDANQTVNGRVSPEANALVERWFFAARQHNVKRISRSKVVAGFVQCFLDRCNAAGKGGNIQANSQGEHHAQASDSPDGSRNDSDGATVQS